MAFAVSDGALRAVERTLDTRPTYSMRVSVDGYAQDYAEIWRKQPAVRTVVDFLGRNIASLGLHGFERVTDTDRKRVTDGPVGDFLRKPNPATTRYQLIDALVHDKCIYDAAYWLKVNNSVIRIPPWMVTPKGGSWLAPDQFRVEGSGGFIDYDADKVVHFHGYNPTDGRFGSPPIEALRATLSEEFEASRMREQTMRNGARMSGYLTRPAGAPDWRKSGGADRFKQSWQAQYSGNGPQAGGTPVLEDGMAFVPAAQTAVQLQYVEARKLTREEVAAQFFIPPPMVGLLDNATFSNIDMQHRMLYQDTLGPWLEDIQQTIELQLLPDLDSTGKIYVEFNLAQKLAGSFEEQASAIQTMVGRPVMTANEGRGRLNLTSIGPDGDQLVTPLNVLVGGQASPTDSAPKARLEPGLKSAGELLDAELVALKARAPQTHDTKAEQVLVKFFNRQAAVVKSKLGAKAAGDFWDSKRWNTELAADLMRLALQVSKTVAASTLDSMGFDPDEYDPDRTVAFLKAVAERNAESINASTKAQIDAALAEVEAASETDDDPEKEPPDPVGDVFKAATGSRAIQIAKTVVTAASGFGTTEAARQVAPGKAKKTWRAGSNPRASHKAMDGETVGIDEKFSNGLPWPGDGGDADEVAGCNCGVEVTVS